MGGLSLSLDMGLGNSSSAFSPASISTIAWYDPSDLTTLFKDTAGTTLVTADGDIVLRINDKSGNGRHMTVAANGPTYKTGGFLRFDGVNDTLTTASFTVAHPFIRSTCLKQISWTANDIIWDARNGAPTQGSLLFQTGASPALRIFDNGTLGATTSAAAIGAAAVVRERYTTSGCGLTVNNGTETTDAVIATAVADGWTLGSDLGAASGFGNFDFYGAVIIAGSTPNASVDTYLGGKAGLAI